MPSYLQERELRGSAVKAGAGFWIRVLARLIDLVFCYMMFFAGLFVGGVALGVLDALGRLPEGLERRLQGEPILIALGSVVAQIVYHSFSEGIGNASLGKLVCGLRVIAKPGKPCGIGRAFLRNLGFMFDGLFCGVVAYASMSDSPLRQRYGDKWANTVVARARDVPEEAKRPGLAMLLAIGGGAALGAIIGTVSVLGQVLA